MRLRFASRLAALVLIGGALGCTDDGDKVTDLSGRLEVTPLYLGVRQGDAPIQYEATIDGAPVAVTWELSNTAAGTLSPTGLMNPSGDGFTAVTATLTSDPSRKKSASLLVTPLYVALTSGQAVNNIAGNIGDTLYYRIDSPAGATNLVIAMSGGTGDLDLYVKRGAVPAYGAGNWDCRPYEAGNNETCTFPSPTAGRYFIWLDVYDNASGVSLVATVTGP